MPSSSLFGGTLFITFFGDAHGVDFNGLSFLKFDAHSIAFHSMACRAKCKREVGCTFWTFDANSPLRTACGTTSDGGSLVRRRGANSGSNHEERCGITGLGVVGHNVLGSSRVASECDCAKQCKRQSGCKGWQYMLDSGDCFLKGHPVTLERSDSSVSMVSAQSRRVHASFRLAALEHYELRHVHVDARTHTPPATACLRHHSTPLHIPR